MATELTTLQDLLLDLISTERAVAEGEVTRLDEGDWDAMLDMARQHRLLPMLHWQLSRDRKALPVPEAVRARLAEGFRRTTLRSLVLQRELLQVHRILDRAGIPYVALKGAWLAFFAYPQPGLRPLRDLDLLVPKDRALEANRILIDGGYEPLGDCLGSPDAVLEHDRHFPPLQSPSGRITIELHVRLGYPRAEELFSDLSPEAAADGGGRIATAILANEELKYQTPTELLLHLIVHAVYDHQFNNGPLLLSDIVYLLQARPVDWPSFWRLAGEYGYERGCILALRLAERYWGQQPIAWPAGMEVGIDPPAEMLDTSARLMLCDFEARIGVSVNQAVSGQGTTLQKIRVLLGLAFPPRALIATKYPVSEHSPWIYFWYPARWWHLARKHLPVYLRVKRDPLRRNEVRQLDAVANWLTRG